MIIYTSFFFQEESTIKEPSQLDRSSSTELRMRSLEKGGNHSFDLVLLLSLSTAVACPPEPLKFAPLPSTFVVELNPIPINSVEFYSRESIR